MPSVSVLTVSGLTQQLKDVVEAAFARVSVVGEVTNCTRAASGHIYFVLKDAHAQIRAVMWRSAAARVRFEVRDGMEVVASGPVELYAARGAYQLIVDTLVPQGIGALELAFRQLQEKLAAEGLFDPQRKRALPRFPRKIALVTSPAGAAVRDMLQILSRRWRATDIIIVPVPVQGKEAALDIAAGLRAAPRIPGVELVITGRGGGSLEDLWAFNTEVVARAIVACPIPVLCGVGHEIDVSIADLVADCRALTPSEAAELAVPLQSEVAGELARIEQRLTSSLCERARAARWRLDQFASRRTFTRPFQRLHEHLALLDELSSRLQRSARGIATQQRQRLSALADALHALSPLAVLKRGYSITQTAAGQLVKRPDDARPGDTIRTTLASGAITSLVQSVVDTPILPQIASARVARDTRTDTSVSESHRTDDG